MSRLRVPVDRLAAGPLLLPEATSRYVARVHRLGVGDRFVAFDAATGMEADARITAVLGRAVQVELGDARPAPVRPARRVTLIQATGKGDKLDSVVRDATELGVSRVVPAITARSVSRPGPDRVERWRRVALQAARQCGRGDAPIVEPPAPLEEAITRFAGSLGACLHPPAPLTLGAFVRRLGASTDVTLLVGPEGGLTRDEVEAAEAAGLRAVTLGPLILRTETACAAVLGALLVADG